MYCISFQINPSFARDFDREEFLARVRQVRSPEVDAIEEKGKLFLSFNFFTEFPAQLWQELHGLLFADSAYAPKLAPYCIVICEGEDEDDCLLLHHFDPNEKLDSF
jgi:hypothetical protein